MKKIIASAVGLVLVGGVAVTNASAVESQFGGYWRTRAFFQDNFTQTDSAFNRTDTRTQIYYTAKFNDNLKFVNKFEFNTLWGDAVGGDIGADGNTFALKNSYIDATFGMINAKVGIQHATISRGFLFDDDFSGAIVTADFGMVKVPVAYMSGPQQDVQPISSVLTGAGLIVTTPALTNDVHILAMMPQIKINDNISVTPNVVWANTTSSDSYVYDLGVDVDVKFDAVSGWATMIYNGGEVDNGAGVANNDISAWLFGAGVDAGIVHGSGFYATGDDNAADTDTENFQHIPGNSYYWSEIMGLGTFDNTASSNAPGDDISNVWALNAGVTVKPMDKLKLDFDVWYAQLAEEKIAFNGQMEDELGLELDAKVTYALMDDLSAEVVFAYLFAGDATGPEDVMEGGVKLSLKF